MALAPNRLLRAERSAAILRCLSRLPMLRWTLLLSGRAQRAASMPGSCRAHSWACSLQCPFLSSVGGSEPQPASPTCPSGATSLRKSSVSARPGLSSLFSLLARHLSSCPTRLKLSRRDPTLRMQPSWSIFCRTTAFPRLKARTVPSVASCDGLHSPLLPAPLYVAPTFGLSSTPFLPGPKGPSWSTSRGSATGVASTFRSAHLRPGDQGLSAWVQ